MGAFRYGVIGAGRQGTAAAFDLVVRGDAEEVLLADVDPEGAKDAAERVNRLSGTEACRPVTLDAAEVGEVTEFLDGLDAAVDAAPLHLIAGVTRAALDARTHVTDLSADPATTHLQFEMHDEARIKGVSILPGCGEAPGLGSNVQAYVLAQLPDPDELRFYDAGLPLEPEPPWNYRLTFHIGGLWNEYAHPVHWLRDGQPVEVRNLDPAETVTIELAPPLGTLEAFPSNAGGSVVRTLGAGLRTYEARVLRYPGHVAQINAFRDLGLFGTEPISVDGTRVAPIEVLNALLGPQIEAGPDVQDIVVARAEAYGDVDGRRMRAVVELRDVPDPATGFTAMERTTGFHVAIVTAMAARGEISSGVIPPEIAAAPGPMLEELRARGFQIEESFEPA
jgi:lysine 6-dehydrogenase